MLRAGRKYGKDVPDLLKTQVIIKSMSMCSVITPVAQATTKRVIPNLSVHYFTVHCYVDDNQDSIKAKGFLWLSFSVEHKRRYFKKCAGCSFPIQWEVEL